MRKKESSILHRHDAFMEAATGRGTSADKVMRISPRAQYMRPAEARSWYLSNGFIKTIVDAPAEDALREWITIRTNRDLDDPANGQKGLNINRLIENRLYELGVREKLKELIRCSRMYAEGGFLYYGIKATIPQTDAALATPIPADLLRLDFLNVISPEYVQVQMNRYSPLSKLYNSKVYYIDGVMVHEDRIAHLVHSYMPEEGRGVSVIETILDAVLAQDSALWSVNHLVFEMAAKVFKSPKIGALSPEKIAEFVAKMKAVLSTQSAIALDEGEEFQRIETGSLNGLKEIFDYIFENLAGFARMPKSRLMGQSQGVITAGQFDLLNYYDQVAKFQELEIRPILEKIISLIVREREGEIYRLLGGAADNLDWEFEFNPLWKIGPHEKAEMELKQAQRDQVYITTGVITPDEVRRIRFDDLEDFPAHEVGPLVMSKVETGPSGQDAVIA